LVVIKKKTSSDKSPNQQHAKLQYSNIKRIDIQVGKKCKKLLFNYENLVEHGESNVNKARSYGLPFVPKLCKNT